MTDRHCVLQIVKALGLTEGSAHDNLKPTEYCETLDGITLGCGEGIMGFEVLFLFDRKGNIEKHEVYE